MSDRADLTVKKTENPDTAPPKSAAELAAEKHERLKAMLAGAGTLEDKVTLALQQVHDPEIPVNIYELGLIYNVEIDAERNVKVTMTLTSPACPAAQELPVEVRRNVEKIDEVNSAEVDVVFDPPWTQDRMSDIAKVTLGMM